jgi:hypothetical protein
LIAIKFSRKKFSMATFRRFQRGDGAPRLISVQLVSILQVQKLDSFLDKPYLSTGLAPLTKATKPDRDAEQGLPCV